MYKKKRPEIGSQTLSQVNRDLSGLEMCYAVIMLGVQYFMVVTLSWHDLSGEVSDFRN
jgi:hypothetical protein